MRAQAPAFLVKDVNTQPAPVSSSPSQFLTIGANTYFVAADGGGSAVWKTDGSAPGTVRVSGVLTAIDYLTEAGGGLFFLGSDGTRTALYASDGTPAATVPLIGIPGVDLTAPPYPEFRLPVVGANGLLFFAMPRADQEFGFDLWRSDGTAAGTFALQEQLVVGGPGTRVTAPAIVSSGRTVFFSRYDGTSGLRLWHSDGSPTGTAVLGPEHQAIELFAAIDGVLLFRAENGNAALWRSDGTPDGTFPLHAFSDLGTFEARAIDGRLYFSATELNAPAPTLWRSDGSIAGTVVASSVTRPDTVTDVDGRLFFFGDIDVVNAPERRALWKTDGTPAGTVFVAEVTPTVSTQTAAVDGLLFFVRNHAVWRSDGTTSGTFALAPIEASDYPPPQLTSVAGVLYVSDGSSLWTSDGTDAGTVRLAALACCQPSQPFGVNGGRLVFAGVGPRGVEPWASDGTLAGTAQIANVAVEPPGPTLNASPQSLTDVDGTLYFTADDGVHGRELWRSDGTPAGTVLVKDINEGERGAGPGPISVVGGTLFLAADDGVTGAELWKSDGSDGGTVEIKDINPGPAGSAPSAVVNVNGTLFFAADDGSSGRELWKSDGSSAGTTRVADINPGSEGSDPRDLTAFGGAVFFLSGNDLWRSDGSGAGTVRVMGLGPTTLPARLATAGGMLFLIVRTVPEFNNPLTVDVYRSDGTPQGTVLLQRIQDYLTLDADHFTAVNGSTFFVAETSDRSGHRLQPFAIWRSDGTYAGTAPIAPFTSAVSGYGYLLDGVPAAATDFIYFPATSYHTDLGLFRSYLFRADDVESDVVPLAPIGASQLTAVQDRLIFGGCTAPEGCEVWESDGTPHGTRRLADVVPGSDSSLPGPFVRSGSLVFFPATAGDTGTELWAVALDALGRCGNGARDPGETCDTAGESATCNADCSPAQCGDGIVNRTTGEECDDGTGARGGCCTASCVAEPMGTSCGTPSTCDGVDVCGAGGVCHFGMAPDCDDHNPATDDYCDDTRGGCTHRPTCAGDCSADGRVTIDELVTMVRVALAGSATDLCAGDSDGNGQYTIDELVAAVVNALHGCTQPTS